MKNSQQARQPNYERVKGPGLESYCLAQPSRGVSRIRRQRAMIHTFPRRATPSPTPLAPASQSTLSRTANQPSPPKKTKPRKFWAFVSAPRTIDTDIDTDLLTHPGDVSGGCLDLLALVQHAPVEVDLRQKREEGGQVIQKRYLSRQAAVPRCS